MAMPIGMGLGVMALAVTGAALGGGIHGTAGPTGAGADAGAHARTTPAPALTRFGSCAAFAAHMRTQAGRRVQAHGLPGRATGSAAIVGESVMADAAGGPARDSAPAATTAPAPATPAPVAGRDHSGTNVQEAGVDEPDIVTTDGRRLYSLTQDTLRVVDVTGIRPQALGSLDMSEIGPTGMLLVDGRLLVLGQAEADPVPMPMPAAAPGGQIAEITPVIAPARPPSSVVAEVDVTDPARMRVTTSVRVDGALVAARRTAGTVRVVVASSPQPPRMVVPASGTRIAEFAALAANRRAVAAGHAGAWLPRMTVRDEVAGSTTHRVAVGCRAVGRPRTYSGLGMVTVLTLGLTDTLRVLDSDAVLTDAEVVYASPESMYIATPRWVDPSGDPARSGGAGTTLVHRLDTSQPHRTAHRSSGVVRGYPLNQFAMSEHDGRLRIATTEEPAWRDGGALRASQSMVTVLGERAGTLVRVGEVDGLGRGERIYSVRFVGDRGYVVTFRETDPLYVVDLADPTRPRVRGELEIPGYSSYLHPVDERTLIGIGQHATDDGRTLGTQVSLFDVADPANPRRVATARIGTGWSEAESDHHAVLYWPATGLLVLPTTSSAGHGSPAGAVGLRVDREAGFTEVGRIGRTAGSPIRRSLVVGDGLYTVSDAGVRRSALDTLAPQGWLDLP